MGTDALDHFLEPVAKNLPPDGSDSDVQVYQEVAEQHGITADTTDEEIDTISSDVWEAFRAEGVILSNVKRALKHVRDHHL